MGDIKLRPIERIYRDKVIQPDATVVNTYKPPQKPVEKLIKEIETKAQAKEQEQRIRRALYKDRKQAERKRKYQNNIQSQKVEIPIELLPDAIIDREIEKEKDMANQPQIYSTNPVWTNYTPEARRQLGYFTNEEREQAARLNDVRSNTIFGNIMPNFGRQFAYYNPGAETDAFRQTALYMPNAVLAGSSFGLPSATQATITGAKAGWQTAGNLAKKTFSAGTQAVKSAAPVVTNPRWAATTAAFTVPAVAQASSSGDYTGLGLGIGVPLTIGVGAYLTKKLWRKKTPDATPASTTAPAGQYAYQPDKRLFTWEHPFYWTDRQRDAVAKSRLNAAIDEWNAAVGDPAKQKKFITDHNIRKTEGTPQFETETISRPSRKRVPVMETVQEPEIVGTPLQTLLGSDEILGPVKGPSWKFALIPRFKVGPGGERVMRSVTRQARNANGNLKYKYETRTNPDGSPIVTKTTKQVPKKGDNGEPIVTYDPISIEQVPGFLEGKVNGYTSNINDVNNMIFRGPTRSQKFWAGARNVGRVGLWLGVPGFIGYQLFKPSGTTYSNNSDKKDDSDSTKVAASDSVRTTKYIEVTPDGRIITQKFDGIGYDTIAPKKYQTPEFDD